MRKFSGVTVAVLAAVALFVLAPAVPARAQQLTNAVSYVSSASTASDSNPCSIDQPCATFNGAISNTSIGGEVRCLNPAGQINNWPGAITISRSITIDCEGIGAQLNRANPNEGIVINGANIVVVLRGLNLNGTGGIFSPSNIGIDIQQARSVLIEKCNIHSFTNAAAQGIRLATASGAVNLTVVDSVITNNGTGIRVLPSGGAALVSLLRVQMYGNSSSGFEATSAAGGTVFGTIVDSTANGNGTNGFAATSFAGGKAVVLDIQHSNANLNAQSGILADGPASKITVGASTVDTNGTGFGRTNGGVILSHGNNNVDDNSVAGSASGNAGQL